MEDNYQFEYGQGLIEYAFIVVLVSLIAITVLSVLGSVVGNVFSNVIANL